MLARMETANIPDVQEPVEQCCYCWYRIHGDEPYPEQQSSTICEQHTAWIVQRLAEQRAQRIANGGCTSSKPLSNWDMLATHPQTWVYGYGGKAQ